MKPSGFQVFFLLFNLVWVGRTQVLRTYFLLPERDPVDVNLLTLQCLTGGGTIRNSLFFLDGFNLEQRNDLRVFRNGGALSFLLRQDLEGNYTCGSSTDNGIIQSARVQFVGEFWGGGGGGLLAFCQLYC